MAEIVSPGRTAEPITEGSEPDEFWVSLGGIGTPMKMADEPRRPVLDPRLFHCKLSVATGKFRAYEIFNFEQDVRTNYLHKCNVCSYISTAHLGPTLKSSSHFICLGHGRRRRDDS